MIRFCIALLLMVSVCGFGADWEQWRGPARDGQTGQNLPGALPDQLTEVWKIEIGEGHSSPLVVGKDIILFSRSGEKEMLRRISAKDGSIKWETGYEQAYTMHPAASGHGKGPKATPLIAGGRIFTFGIDGMLSAYGLADGKMIWQKDYSKEFPKNSPVYGASASPIAWNDGIVIHIGGEKNGALVMLDAATGKEQWRWDGDGPGYASPVIVKTSSGEQLVTQTEVKVAGFDAGGQLLWERSLVTPYHQNSVTPMVSGDHLIYSGLDAGSFALKLNWDNPEVVWQNKEIFSYMSSPVLVDGRIYRHSPKRKGMFVCQDAKTGKVIWTSEGRDGENAAFLVAGKHILALTTDAKLVIFKAGGASYKPVKTYDVAGSPTWAHPALVDGNHLVVKDKNHLILYRF